MGRRTNASMGIDSSAFARSMRAYRTASEMGCREAAQEIGISVGALLSYERGEALPNLVQFIKLCRWMDEDPGWLMGKIVVNEVPA